MSAITRDSPGLPVAYVTLKPGTDGWLWVVESCPYCGKRHTHGGGERNEEPRRLLGHRVQHCGPGPGRVGYILVEKVAK